MKALIKVGYGCNDHCSFCHTLYLRDVNGSADEVHRKIERAKELGHAMVVLSGGEPTIRPELYDWAAHVASLDMDFGLVTNGRLLSYPEATERLLGHRLRYVYLSLHGGTERVHNLMVRSQAFDETYGALANLTGKGLDLWANCVITQHNVDHLLPLVDALLPYDDLKAKFSMVEPKGGGDKLFRSLMPRVGYVAEKVREALDYAEQKTAGRPGPHFTHGAIALCLMRGYEDRYDDLKTHRFATMVEVGEPDFFPVDDRNKVQPEETCRGCTLSGPCPGVYEGYFEEFGAGELSPVRDQARSNSYNYGLVRMIDAGAAACPLRDGATGVTPWDRGRHLFVRNGAKVALFRADSRDFSDVEMEQIKHGVGQVYFDASTKDAPNDFARDLVKLEPAGMCAACPEQPTCTGMFEPRYEDVFGRDDARVRELLGALGGRVLDLGCGDAPYRDVLEPRAREGHIEYTGVDPDRARIEALRGAWPWARLEVGIGEDLPFEGERFDHGLVLRSWNHLRDPHRAIFGLLTRLRPGGTLLVVDNVAFGLARTRRQVTRGEASSAELEHYRNDGAPEAHRVLAAFGLEELERRDVAAATSNQWLLRYRIPSDYRVPLRADRE